jgi:hypothetical protein
MRRRDGVENPALLEVVAGCPHEQHLDAFVGPLLAVIAFAFGVVEIARVVGKRGASAPRADGV